MAGVVGAGGLGDLAIRFGYQRFQTDVMVVTVVLLLVLVQILQTIGDKLVVHFRASERMAGVHPTRPSHSHKERSMKNCWWPLPPSLPSPPRPTP